MPGLDKVLPSERDSAHSKFQEIAFAYAILSDERRRKRYDTTGNTSESLTEDDDFNWADFFRTQFGDPEFKVNRLNEIRAGYQNSFEEKRDVLAAYTKTKGDMNAVFREVMLSNSLDDEERFRLYINAAIEKGEVEAFHAYMHENPRKRAARHKKAAKEAEEASVLSREIFGKETTLDDIVLGKKRRNTLDDLVDRITSVKKARTARRPMHERSKAHRRKSRHIPGDECEDADEPPEEAFEKNRKLRKEEGLEWSPPKRDEKEANVVEDDDFSDARDLQEDSGAGEDGLEDEEEDVTPAKSRAKRKRPSTRAQNGRARKTK